MYFPLTLPQEVTGVWVLLERERRKKITWDIGHSTQEIKICYLNRTAMQQIWGATSRVWTNESQETDTLRAVIIKMPMSFYVLLPGNKMSRQVWSLFEDGLGLSWQCADESPALHLVLPPELMKAPILLHRNVYLWTASAHDEFRSRIIEPPTSQSYSYRRSSTLSIP